MFIGLFRKVFKPVFSTVTYVEKQLVYRTSTCITSILGVPVKTDFEFQRFGYPGIYVRKQDGKTV
jgi:hypothetical protein